MDDTLHLPSGRRRSRRGLTRGRLYLALMFLLLFAFHLVTFFLTPSYNKQEFLLHEVPIGMVTTSLIAGVWCRQFWARYLLMAVALYRVVASCIFLPRYTELMLADWVFALVMLTGPTLYAAITWALYALPSIRRLVSRRYD